MWRRSPKPSADGGEEEGDGAKRHRHELSDLRARFGSQGLEHLTHLADHFNFNAITERYGEQWEQTKETLENFEKFANEVTTLELPPPNTYPPAPHGEIAVPDPFDDEEEGEEVPTHPLAPSPDTKEPPRLPSRQLQFAEGELPKSFGFACGGWLQFYMFGVAKCLKQHGVHKKAKFAGCSAGALTALGLCVEPSNFDAAIEYCKMVCIPRCRGTVRGPFLLHKYVRGCLEYTGCLDEHWEITRDRLHVAVTQMPGFRPVCLKNPASKTDLIKALLASSAAFPMAPPVKLDNKWYIDGGLSDFQPTVDKETITVNPFYFSQADIRPSRYVPAWWSMLPPSNAGTVDWLYDLGYLDTLTWMDNVGLGEYCQKHCRKEGGDIYACKHRPQRGPHPFDEHSRSFGRFFGYGSWPWLIDLLTTCMVEICWRGTAFLLIYTELFCKLCFVGIRLLTSEALQMRWALMMGAVLLFPHVMHMLSAFWAILLLKMLVQGATGPKEWQLLRELLASLCSASLFLRSLPLIGKKVVLRKHHKLFRQSLVYRVMVHII